MGSLILDQADNSAFNGGTAQEKVLANAYNYNYNLMVPSEKSQGASQQMPAQQLDDVPVRMPSILTDLSGLEKMYASVLQQDLNTRSLHTSSSGALVDPAKFMKNQSLGSFLQYGNGEEPKLSDGTGKHGGDQAFFQTAQSNQMAKEPQARFGQQASTGLYNMQSFGGSRDHHAYNSGRS